MGNYCTAVNNSNQVILDYLKNNVFEINHQKAYGEEPLEWRFDTFWKKRLVIPKILKDKHSLDDMTYFISSFPEMKKNKNQKIIKEYKQWPFTTMGIVKSKFLVDYDILNETLPTGKNEYNKDFKDLQNYTRSRTKELIGSGFLIGNFIVLTLVKNIYLRDKKTNFKGKYIEKEIKASEVKFYAFFNGNTGIECEIEYIHHLDYISIGDIHDNIALLFLKKPIGEELGYLGVWEKFDYNETQNVDVIGYLYDDIYENKIYLSDLKIQIKSEKITKFEIKESKANNFNEIRNNEVNDMTSEGFKTFTHLKQKNMQIRFLNNFLSTKNNQKNQENSNNQSQNITKNLNKSQELNVDQENNKLQKLIKNPEFFYFQTDQQFNLLPGAAIMANKHNIHFLLGLYIGKEEKTNLHYGRFLQQNISDIKEWILNYWYENKKENTKLLLGGNNFKEFKIEAFDIIIKMYNNLNCLNLNDCCLIDDDVLLIVKNLNLKVLKLRNNNLKTNTAIHIANNQRNIEELDLSYNYIGYVGIKEIAWKLKKIKIFHLEKIGLKDNSLEDIGANLIDLHFLDISKNFITNEGVMFLSKGNVNLSELNLGSNEFITDESIEYIGENLLKVENLYLNETTISDNGITFLSNNLTFIKKLNLSRCNISDNGINNIISNLKYLNSLNIYKCNISDDFKISLVKSRIIKNLIV